MRTFLMNLAACALLFLVTPQLSAQQTGIRFEKIAAMKTLLLKAKQLKKPLFIDAYATWCGPCKSMDADVYPEKIVGDFYNKHFINAKFDIEAGEGPKLAEQYRITSIPTYLVISPEGKLLHRGVGYKSVEELIAFGKQSQDSKNNLAFWDDQYNAGKYEPAFLLTYAREMLEGYGEVEKGRAAFDKYIAQPKVTYNDTTLQVLAQLLTQDPGHQPYRDIFTNHAKDFSTAVKDKRSLYMGYAGYFMITSATEIYGEQADLSKVETKVKAVLPEVTAPVMTMIKYAVASDEEHPDLPAMLQLAEQVGAWLYDTDEQRAEFYNDLSWKTFEANEKQPDENVVKLAVKLGLASIKLKQEFANTDTVAQLYGLLKDKANAVKYGKQALEFAQKEGLTEEDTQKTRDLVAQLAAN